MPTLENNIQNSFIKEITSLLKKNYCSNINLYSNLNELPSYIMSEIIKISNMNKTNNINKIIGLSSDCEIYRFIDKQKEYTLLTLDIFGFDFLQKSFGQNAVYDVIKKITDIISQNIINNYKCCLKENILLVIIENNKKNKDFVINKILLSINSTMVFTNNHLFNIKTNYKIFYNQKSKDIKNYL